MRPETHMSTQPGSPGDDLDRTDELPQLDVAAYEASLADGNKGLSRTDTWTVEALRDIDELAESAQQDARSATHGANDDSSEALTVNVERILKRIADVEADNAAAHEVNEAVRKRNEAIQAERDEQAQRARALEAENARLTEHRELADEMARRLERQLREQSQHAEKQLKELQATHSAERLQAGRDREELQRQIAQLAAQGEALQENNLALQDQLQTSSTLAHQHAQSLAALGKSLGDERTSAAGLARQLAAKLKDFEGLAVVVDARNRSIEELSRIRDDLGRELERETAAGVQLSTRFATTEQNLHASQATLLEREKALAEKERQLAQLTADLNRTAVELQSAREQHAVAQRNLSALDTTHKLSTSELSQRAEEMSTLRASLQAAELREAGVRQELSVASIAVADEERQGVELQAQLQEMQQKIAALTSDHDAAQAQIRSLGQERDALLPASTQLAALSAQLEQSGTESAQLRSELAAARAEAESQVQLLNERTDELTSLRAKFGDHGAELHGLELTIRARDELVEALRTQLQTTRDERGIIAIQLDKARTRVKSLTEHIFSRDNLIAELQADLAVHTEALAAIRRDVNRIGGNAGVAAAEEVERILEPVEHDGAPITLNGKTFTVGRTTENDISIPSKLVSRHHARLLVGPTGVIVEDAGSTNGCFVNGEQVKHHLMHDGDVLELGDLRYRLRIRSVNDTRARTNVVPFDSRRPDD